MSRPIPVSAETARKVRAAVDGAIATAWADASLSAPDRIGFDPAALEAVMVWYRRDATRDVVVAAADAALYAAMDALGDEPSAEELLPARAAIALGRRVTAIRDRRYVEGKDGRMHLMSDRAMRIDPYLDEE